VADEEIDTIPVHATSITHTVHSVATTSGNTAAITLIRKIKMGRADWRFE
jgi:hypothetical protein